MQTDIVPRTALEWTLHNAAPSFVPHDGYSIRTSSRFWTMVFEEHYGVPPESDTDPRWDGLIKEGYAALKRFDF